MPIPDKINMGILIIQTITLIALVGAFIVYFQQLKIMKKSLNSSSAFNLRNLHMELLRLAIIDSDIMKVWHFNKSSLSTEDYKCHLFVNLHLSHIEMLFKQNYISKEYLNVVIRKYSQNPYYHKFWSNAREERGKALNKSNSKEIIFYNLCEKAYLKTND